MMRHLVLNNREVYVLHLILFVLLIIGILIGDFNLNFFEILLLLTGYSLVSLYITRLILNKRSLNLVKSSKYTNTQLAKSAVNALVTMVELRDSYTSKHSSNVAGYAYSVAKSMQLPDDVCRDIYIGCKLHDLGKVYVPDDILKKPGRLTAEEFDIVKAHPEKGYQVVSQLEIFDDTCIPNIVLYHHERFDGTGYPKGLFRTDIPIEARIVAICDAYDAMTTTRTYRKAMPPEEAIQIIEDNKGSQFDPIIAEHFVRCIREEEINEVDALNLYKTNQRTS